MSKICDVVDLKTGYANYVELKSAWEESQENADRMAMYRPTHAHRQAFERICQGLYKPYDKKFYLLSGSYGTGKSHLCLMTANVLSRSSGDPEISGFYENYEKLSPEKAKQLRNIRKDGQYLVAICDYHSGQHFEDIVMKAVLKACNARGLDADLKTEFDEAERQLAEWEKQGEKGGFRNFYEDFEKVLEKIAPGLSVEQLRTGLQNYDSEMLEKFRIAFPEMTGGVTFHPRSGNLIPIIRKLVRSSSFRERFKGLAIFFDEFGFILEKGGYSKDVLQGFMETICKNEPNVLFVGCIHKDFKSYADQFTKDDAAVMSARITQVDLLNEGIEEIIGAIVETDKTCDTWKTEIAPKTGVFDQLVPPCKTLDLFPWIGDVNRIRQRVLEDIYGVHPVALSCLLTLSSEIGSDVRSTFTFFSGEVGGAAGSYADFIQNAEITIGGGKLNLYRVDRLFAFFKKELSRKNPELREGLRQLVNGYYASMDALRKAARDELLRFHEDERVFTLKAILIYHLCQIPATLENLQFGLYCLSSSEKNSVKGYLKNLEKNGAVFFRQQSKTYELAASTGEDPYDMIDRFLNDKSLHPEDMVSAFLEESGDKRLPDFAEARGYNMQFSEDKRFRIRFVRPRDIGAGLWDECGKDYEASRFKPAQSYEGTLVYVLCETEAEINSARESAKTIYHDNIAMAVPHKPQPFTETLLKVKACRYYLPPNDRVKISAQTESRLRDIFENPEDGYLTSLKRIFREIQDGEKACWYKKDGRILVDKPKQPHKPADILCETLYTKRCRIKHPDLNLCHDDKWLKGKNTPLKQAVTVLLSAEKVFIDKGNPDNHGQKRYLEKALFKGAGALKKTGEEGAVTCFSCETDPDRIHDDFPVLKELCVRLANLGAREILSVAAFLEEVRNPPYGAGGTSMILSLAHVIRGYGEQLIVYKDSTRMQQEKADSYEYLAGIVSDPSAKTVFEIRNISPVQYVFIDRIAKAVGASPLKHKETRSVNSAWEALMKWWNELPSVAKILDLYEKEQRPRLSALKNEMGETGKNADRFDFLLERLPDVYTGKDIDRTFTKEEAERIADEFAQDVKLLHSGRQIVTQKISQTICELFGTEGDIVACEKAVTQWYLQLSSAQRDPYAYESEEATELLNRLGEQNIDFRTKMEKLLPADYGFGAVSDWTSLHVRDYAAKLRQARAEIDKSRPFVYKPAIENGVHEVQESQTMEVKVPEGASSLIYSLDGKDPRSTENVLKTEQPINLSELLKEKPSVRVKMRAMDREGNVSDTVSFELVSRERKYDITEKKDVFGNKEVSFKSPEDTEGFIAVMKSVIDYGIKKNLLKKERADKLKAQLNELTAQ